ncbi:Methionine aminopeptidase [uncultured archaeon]|nr:Methionine aminopeptidase [uncultured archaeon]
MEDLEKWRKAGKIAREALEYGASLVKNGAKIREVCDKIDAKIIELGAKPAWPTQIGLDATAAHFTPENDDESVFKDNLVCLDVGAHVDGCIGDNALTIDLSGKYSDIIKASEEALKNAIKVLQVGTTLGEIGKTIQETIESFGLSPIRNLSGHGLSPWEIHDKPSIPNHDTNDTRKLEKDQIIAIEPFATNGAGLIYEADHGNIFSLIDVKPIRSPYAREILNYIGENYKNLPFTTRWLIKQFGPGKTNLAINEMMRNGMLHAYPPLVEKNKGMVAVFEKTILIGDKIEILT